MPTGRRPESFSSVSRERTRSSRSVASSSSELRSWIQPCNPISCRPLCMMARTESGCSNPLTAGTKKDAGILCRSSSAKMRGNPARERQ